MKHLIISCLIVFFTATIGKAQDLVYQPINPAFGGETFNYQWMLSSANSQNDFNDSSALGRFGAGQQSAVDSFGANLNNQVINQLTNSLFGNAFGEGGLAPGNYTFGGLNVDIVPTNAGLSITIIDTNTGEASNIIIPFF